MQASPSLEVSTQCRRGFQFSRDSSGSCSRRQRLSPLLRPIHTACEHHPVSPHVRMRTPKRWYRNQLPPQFAQLSLEGKFCRRSPLSLSEQCLVASSHKLLSLQLSQSVIQYYLQVSQALAALSDTLTSAAAQTTQLNLQRATAVELAQASGCLV